MRVAGKKSQGGGKRLKRSTKEGVSGKALLKESTQNNFVRKQQESLRFEGGGVREKEGRHRPKGVKFFKGGHKQGGGGW